MNYIDLLESEMDVLHTLSNELVSLDMTNNDNKKVYEQDLERIMETSEGIFLYAMTYLYDFDYLYDDVI